MRHSAKERKNADWGKWDLPTISWLRNRGLLTKEFSKNSVSPSVKGENYLLHVWNPKIKWIDVCKVSRKHLAGIGLSVAAGSPSLFSLMQEPEVSWVTLNLVHSGLSPGQFHGPNTRPSRLNPNVQRTCTLAFTVPSSPSPRLLTRGQTFIWFGRPRSFKMWIYWGCNSDFNL